MKKQTKKRGKAIALSLAMAAALSLPMGAWGQGLFFWSGDSEDEQELLERGELGLLGRSNRGNMESYFTHQSFGNDHSGLFTHQTFGNDGSNNMGFFTHQTFGNDQSGSFTHQNFGTDAPTGSGMLILLSAGIGYAATKRKKQNKKNQQNKRNQFN